MSYIMACEQCMHKFALPNCNFCPYGGGHKTTIAISSVRLINIQKKDDKAPRSITKRFMLKYQ